MHALAHTRKIKDTSREGRYHNKRFVELARELGLTPPDKPDTGIGFSACTLGDLTAAAYTSTIEAMDAAALAYLVDLDELLNSVVITGTGSTTTRRAASPFRAACLCWAPRPSGGAAAGASPPSAAAPHPGVSSSRLRPWRTGR
ncbi:hypothetical protein [Nonomuraea recticatena]|uniref:Uncharacterized protein n=1 Tax=Nonomuraea recticatena TaxID=46178 RepID=A0ABP6F468_9ACTN